MRNFILSCAACLALAGCAEAQKAGGGVLKATPGAVARAAEKVEKNPTAVGLISAGIGLVYDLAMAGVDAVKDNPVESSTAAAGLGGAGLLVAKKRKKKKKAAEEAAKKAAESK